MTEDTTAKDVYFFCSASRAAAPGAVSTCFTPDEIDKICMQHATLANEQNAFPIRYKHEGPIVGRVICFFRLHNNNAGDSLGAIGKIDGNTEAAQLFRERDSKLLSMRIATTTIYDSSLDHTTFKKLEQLALLDEPADPETKEGLLLGNGPDLALLAHFVYSLYYLDNHIAYIHELDLQMLHRCYTNMNQGDNQVHWVQVQDVDVTPINS